MKKALAYPTLLACLLAPHQQADAARADGDVEWVGIYSDTTAQFVSPMAPKAGESFTIALRAFANDLTGVRARVWFAGPNQEAFIDLASQPTLPGAVFTRWEGQVTPPAGTQAVYWRFELSDGDDLDYYDAGVFDDAPTLRGMSDEYRGDDNNFQLPIGFDTPDWSKEAIWYQIFPERFFNGDPSNDRLDPDDSLWYLDWGPEGTGSGKDCELHADWDASPTGPCDFFGGDLNGVSAKMDYISSLNINALYLNPVFRSRSNHKYDTMDYTEVDPRFGGLEALEAVVADAKGEGWNVIVDGVFNHTSDQSIYYNAYPDLTSDPFYPESIGIWEQDFLSQGESPWGDWFKVWEGADDYDVDRDGNTSEPALHTCGWYGFEFMPNFDFGHPSNPDSEVRTWLYGGSSASNPIAARNSIAGMWMADGQALETGLDGWRLDVPDNAGYATGTSPGDCSWADNDTTIWKGFRDAVKTANPEAYITGEIWRDASTNGGQNWFFNDTFDGVMNYHYFGMPLTCYLNGSGVHEATVGSFGEECQDAYALMKKGATSDLQNFDAHLANQRRVYPAAAYQSSQNLISSHDTARWISRIGASEDTLINAYYWQAALPGAPMIYYGDEIGLEGYNDPDNRRTFPWDDASGADETNRRNILSDLMCVREAHDALSTGSFKTLELNSQTDVYAFSRWTQNETAVVALNNGQSSRTVRVDAESVGMTEGDVMIDALSGQEITVTGGQLTLNVPGQRGVILIDDAAAAASSSCRALNAAPTADAGDNPAVFSSEENITLDGSGSFDPDGDSLSYVWRNEAGGVVGSSAVVTLPPKAPGSYIFFLTVSDGEFEDTDVVEVIVETPDGGGCTSASSGESGLLSLLALLLPLGILRRRS